MSELTRRIWPEPGSKLAKSGWDLAKCWLNQPQAAIPAHKKGWRLATHLRDIGFKRELFIEAHGFWSGLNNGAIASKRNLKAQIFVELCPWRPSLSLHASSLKTIIIYLHFATRYCNIAARKHWAFSLYLSVVADDWSTCLECCTLEPQLLIAAASLANVCRTMQTSDSPFCRSTWPWATGCRDLACFVDFLKCASRRRWSLSKISLCQEGKHRAYDSQPSPRCGLRRSKLGQQTSKRRPGSTIR